MSSFDDYEKAKYVHHGQQAPSKLAPGDKCEAHDHYSAKHEPTYINRGPDFIDNAKSEQWTLLWIVVAALVFYSIYWNHLRTSNSATGVTPSDIIEKAHNKAESFGGVFKKTIDDTFEFLATEIVDIKKRLDKIEKAIATPKAVAHPRPRVKYKTQVEGKTEAEKLLAIKLAHRERVWKIFYETPLGPNESHRTHCFGGDCRTIYPKDIEPARLRIRNALR